MNITLKTHPNIDDRKQAVVKAIVAYIETEGHVVETRAGRLTFGKVIDECTNFSIYKQGTSNRGFSLASRAGSKLRICVGSYGNKRQFPEPKTGFRIAEIGDLLIQNSLKEKTERAHRERRQAAVAVSMLSAKDISTELALTDVYDLKCERSYDADKVRVKIDTTLTPELARKILAFAKEVLAEAAASDD